MLGISLTAVMSTDGTEVGLQTMQQKMNLLDGIKIPPGAANKFSVFQSGEKKKLREFKFCAEKGKSSRSILTKNIIALFKVNNTTADISIILLLFPHSLTHVKEL